MGMWYVSVTGFAYCSMASLEACSVHTVYAVATSNELNCESPTQQSNEYKWCKTCALVLARAHHHHRVQQYGIGWLGQGVKRTKLR